MTQLTPVLSAHWDEADSFTIEGYKRHGGYKAVATALAKAPDDSFNSLKILVCAVAVVQVSQQV